MILHHLFHVAKIQTIPWQYKGFSLIGKGNSLKAPPLYFVPPRLFKTGKTIILHILHLILQSPHCKIRQISTFSFIFFAKNLQEFRKGYTFAVYYNNSTLQQ